MDVRGYVEANARAFLDDLKQWLTIPSISADPARHGDVRHSAAWLAGHLRGAGFGVAEVWDTGGLLNVARLAADVSYTLDALPPAPEIFARVAEAGGIPATTMYATFNMGTGFCVVVAPADVEAALAALTGAGEQPVVAGSVTDRPGRHVSIPAAGLLGRGDAFETTRDTV